MLRLVVPLSVCGNGVVEGWEECDCGEDESDCTEKCCFPANAKDAKPCSLRNGAECRLNDRLTFEFASE